MKARNAFWRVRAIAEILDAKASYLATFTLSPERVLDLERRASLRLSAQGASLPERRCLYEISETDGTKTMVPNKAYFRAVEAEGYRELNLMTKRVRAEGYSLRYFLVAEPHLSDRTAQDRLGLPHWHALVHSPREEVCHHHDKKGRPLSGGECDCLAHRLKHHWSHMGFSDFQPISEGGETGLIKAASYVAKYISKAMTVRVRSSHRYGLSISDN